MKQLLCLVIFLFSFTLTAQQYGVGLNLQFISQLDTTDNGTGEVVIKENNLKGGGSFHYFKDEDYEFIGSLFMGYEETSNGVSETNQVFWGLGAGANLHVLKKEVVTLGAGLSLGLDGYLEPKRTPEVETGGYLKYRLALEVPLFLDVRLNEGFTVRFSAVAAGLVLDYHSQEVQGVTETQQNFYFYSYTTSEMNQINWFPVRINIIYRFNKSGGSAGSD